MRRKSIRRTESVIEGGRDEEFGLSRQTSSIIRLYAAKRVISDS